MRKYFKNIVLATLATATLTTGAATQAHAGSDLRRAILGAVAIGVIANEVKKKNEHRREVAPRYSTRSFDRRHRSDRRRSIRSHRGGYDQRRGGYRRSYGY